MITDFSISQRGMLAVCAVLLTLIGITLIHIFWQWHSDWHLTQSLVSVKPTIAKSSETSKLIASLPKAHLFGNALSKDGQVPITNLQLRVTGIVKVEGDESNTFSKAYISISGQPSKIYQVGDHLPYGVKIYAILPDAVILENDGHLEKLPLPREPLQFNKPLSARVKGMFVNA